MKKLVPFKKEINFKTMVSKITSISLEHTLRIEDNNLITGHFIVEGTYKMTQASQIDEEFSYKIPVDIEIDDKYDISDVIIDIDDFTYEVVDEDRLELNITLCIDNFEEREERKVEILDDLFLETATEQELEIVPEIQNENNEQAYSQNNVKNAQSLSNSEQPINDDSLDYDINEDIIKEQNKNDEINKNSFDNSVNSLFSSFKDSVETFKTYCVYIVKDGDTLDSILNKYNIDKDSLAEYNDLSDINIGSKILIPSVKNE